MSIILWLQLDIWIFLLMNSCNLEGISMLFFCNINFPAPLHLIWLGFADVCLKPHFNTTQCCMYIVLVVFYYKMKPFLVLQGIWPWMFSSGIYLDFCLFTIMCILRDCVWAYSLSHRFMIFFVFLQSPVNHVWEWFLKLFFLVLTCIFFSY